MKRTKLFVFGLFTIFLTPLLLISEGRRPTSTHVEKPVTVQEVRYLRYFNSSTLNKINNEIHNQYIKKDSN